MNNLAIAVFLCAWLALLHVSCRPIVDHFQPACSTADNLDSGDSPVQASDTYPYKHQTPFPQTLCCRVSNDDTVFWDIYRDGHWRSRDICDEEDPDCPDDMIKIFSKSRHSKSSDATTYSLTIRSSLMFLFPQTDAPSTDSDSGPDVCTALFHIRCFNEGRTEILQNWPICSSPVTDSPSSTTPPISNETSRSQLALPTSVTPRPTLRDMKAESTSTPISTAALTSPVDYGLSESSKPEGTSPVVIAFCAVGAHVGAAFVAFCVFRWWRSKQAQPPADGTAEEQVQFNSNLVADDAISHPPDVNLGETVIDGCESIKSGDSTSIYHSTCSLPTTESVPSTNGTRTGSSGFQSGSSSA